MATSLRLLGDQPRRVLWWSAWADRQLVVAAWVDHLRRVRPPGSVQPEPSRSTSLLAGLQIAPVWSAVTLLADAWATAEVRVLDEGGEVVRDGLPVWCDPDLRPNQDQSQVDLRRHVAMSYLVGGNAYVQILTTEDGYPSSIVSVPPGEASLTWIKGEAPKPGKASYTINYRGSHVPYSSANPSGTILHIRWFTLASRVLGISPLEQVAPPLRTSLAAEANAELYFASGGMPPSILVYKDPGAGSVQLDELLEHYKEIRRRPEMAHIPLPLEGDVQWLTNYINPEQSQLLDSRKFSWFAASALYHCHPILLGAPSAATTLSGLREVRREHREGTQQRFLDAMAAAFTELLSPGLHLDARPAPVALPPLEKARYWERVVGMKAATPAEARRELTVLPDRPDVISDEPLVGSVGSGGDSDSGKDDGTNQDGSEEGATGDDGEGEMV